MGAELGTGHGVRAAALALQSRGFPVVAPTERMAMEARLATFRAALESLDRVKADSIFQQVLSDHSPIDAVEFVVQAR